MPAISSTSASERRPATRRQVAIALAIVLLALIGLDRLYGLSFDYVYARSSFNVAAQVQRADPETLILGASGGKYALDPVTLGARSYNAAENGQSGYYVAALLNALPTGGSLKRVIYAFDPGDVAAGLNGPNVKHLARFTPWSSSDPQLFSWLSRGRIVEALKLHSGFYRYRGLNSAAFRGWRRPDWSDTGFEPLSGVMAPQPLPVHPPAPVVPPAPEGKAMLEVIAAAVRRHQAQMVVVVAPMYGHDRSAMPEYADLFQIMRNSFRDLSFCDLTAIRDDPRLKSLTATHTFYFEGAHANAEGARYFSALVRDLIVSRCGG